MGNIIQHLRGSVVDHSTYTGKKGEISLVTDASEARIPTGEIRIHDDSTPGGLPIVLGTTTNPLTSNIVLGSGVGINFHNYGSEDSNSATTVGNNLLDDYETGTWTPALVAGSGSVEQPIGGRAQGQYIKIGNIVIAQFDWYNNTSGSLSYTGTLKITGFPFSVSRFGAGDGGEPFNEANIFMDNLNLSLNTDNIVSILSSGISTSEEILIRGLTNTGTQTSTCYTDMAKYLRVNSSNPSHIRGTVTYTVA